MSADLSPIMDIIDEDIDNILQDTPELKKEGPSPPKKNPKAAPVRRMTRVMKQMSQTIISPSKKKTSKHLLIDKEAENEKIKSLLLGTSFIGEYTQHSNPLLQAKISEDE